MAALSTSLLHLALGQAWASEVSGWLLTASAEVRRREQVPEVILDPAHTAACLHIALQACSEPSNSNPLSSSFAQAMVLELGG
jgi:hypothetical protein